MQTQIALPVKAGSIALLLSVFFLFNACGSFPRGVKLLREGDQARAREQFERTVDHSVYAVGAQYYLHRLDINEEPGIMPWLDIHRNLFQLEEKSRSLPLKTIQKLRRYDAGRADILRARENLRGRIVDSMSIAGSVTEMRYLEAEPGGWSFGTVDSLRTIIANKTINPRRQVYDTELDPQWIGKPLRLPTPFQLRDDPGWSCFALDGPFNPQISYEDATIIANHFTEAILPANYSVFWGIQEDMWELFQRHHPYCEMERFQEEHPTNAVAMDCWFEQASDTLCLSRLRPLLAFHRNNPHTALDGTICNQIMCLAAEPGALRPLSEEESRQVRDIERMSRLHHQLFNCGPEIDSLELISTVAGLARNYTHHRVVFDLAAATGNYFALGGRLALARVAADSLRPLFPDTLTCPPGHYFQVDKQQWFDEFVRILDRLEADGPFPNPVPVTAWNTLDHDEYALVGYGETDEVFFVRKNPGTGMAVVMTSLLDNQGQWDAAKPVPELSVSSDIQPQSISEDGLMILLKADGQLWRSQRRDIGRPWSKPELMPLPEAFAGSAWLTPDDSLLLYSYYTAAPSALRPPTTNLAAAKLQPSGHYGKSFALGQQINSSDASEGRPCMALNGRLLFFTSDRSESLGYEDLYSIPLHKPYDWSSAGAPMNMGFPLSTIFSESGITYFSEYTGNAFFDRLDRCSRQRDIYQEKVGAGIFPANALRLAGILLDENDQPIHADGFMEFTPNYDLDVHSQPISSRGTYTYTVADSTEVVRLFPEVPGYYSENDVTHFLAETPPGTIIRDTFRLTSFDFIRREFRLVHSTFFNGTSQFDRPARAYPELTRLAKIATRMGAELELTGHTDGTGAEAGNQQLSIDRAQSVKQFLVDKCGFDPDRIRVFGYGSSRPICPNDTEEGRRCNRRVEVVFQMPELPENVVESRDQNG